MCNWDQNSKTWYLRVFSENWKFLNASEKIVIPWMQVKIDSFVVWTWPANGQIPLFRLPSDIRDYPVTSPSAQIPLCRLPRKLTVRGLVSREAGVMEFGLKGTSRDRGLVADVTGKSTWWNLGLIEGCASGWCRLLMVLWFAQLIADIERGKHAEAKPPLMPLSQLASHVILLVLLLLLLL